VSCLQLLAPLQRLLGVDRYAARPFQARQILPQARSLAFARTNVPLGLRQVLQN
jgi:hypothetical protein